MTNYFDPVSAKETALSIAANEISAQEAVDACAKRATSVEPALKIFAHENPNLSVGSGPLSGISIGVKDVFDTSDMPTAYNSAIYQDYHPKADAALVSMLREAGATIAGKTVTTEYAFFTPGPTTNPHNQNHTPGGSSSGSAAGVAAGIFRPVLDPALPLSSGSLVNHPARPAVHGLCLYSVLCNPHPGRGG